MNNIEVIVRGEGDLTIATIDEDSVKVDIAGRDVTVNIYDLADAVMAFLPSTKRPEREAA